jgi:CRP-like cAMP-binding protein
MNTQIEAINKELSGDNFANVLLSSLDDAGRKRFAPYLEPVSLKAKQVLYHPNARITEIYFPETCVTAMLTVMEDGSTIESATVGREGASWISASFKSPTMPCQTMVAIAGDAYKIPTEVVESEIKKNGEFHNTLSHYSHTLLIQTLRSTACNGLHTLTQRCARWILTVLDRTDLDHFVMTHEFLASLLGVHRPGISELVERLSTQGILQNTRGQFRVADREKLERASCECYGIMREQFTNLVIRR